MNFAKFSRLTRLDQTIFSLPFLLTSLLVALQTAHFQLEMIMILPAFLCARIAGMAFNQVIDSAMDAKNQRTCNRLIPRGEVSKKTALWIAWGALALFFLCAVQLGRVILLLSIPACFLIAIYSYMKRIHASCHLVLGMIHFLAPVMAWTALTGRIELPAVLLGLTACCLVTGSDILYAFQDIDFDRKEGLHSIPARLGSQKALILAKLFHLLALGSAVCFGFFAHLGVIYFLAPLTSSLFFSYFYRKGKNESLLCNVVVSVSIFTFTALELACRAL